MQSRPSYFSRGTRNCIMRFLRLKGKKSSSHCLPLCRLADAGTNDFRVSSCDFVIFVVALFKTGPRNTRTSTKYHECRTLSKNGALVSARSAIILIRRSTCRERRDHTVIRKYRRQRGKPRADV